jgi:hypothetical protein
VRVVVRADRTARHRALALVPSLRQRSKYYFSSLGNDATGNGSLASPWQSIGKFNTLSLRPGDSALFRAGDTFTGKMWLDANDAGTNGIGSLVAPVTIGSFGAVGATTRAKIVSPYNNEGFVAYNAGIDLNDLEFVSGGFSNVRTNGVHFDGPRRCRAPQSSSTFTSITWSHAALG